LILPARARFMGTARGASNFGGVEEDDGGNSRKGKKKHQKNYVKGKTVWKERENYYDVSKGLHGGRRRSSSGGQGQGRLGVRDIVVMHCPQQGGKLFR